MFNFILLLYECSLTRNVSASEQQHLLSKLQAIYQNFSATPIKETESLVNMITNMALQRVYTTQEAAATNLVLSSETKYANVEHVRPYGPGEVHSSRLMIPRGN